MALDDPAFIPNLVGKFFLVSTLSTILNILITTKLRETETDYSYINQIRFYSLLRQWQLIMSN